MTLPETIAKLRERVRDYLISGGLFNPEMAIHDRVKDLIVDLDFALEARESEKPRDWWTVGERTPTKYKHYLVWLNVYSQWMEGVVEYGRWSTKHGKYGVEHTDIYREMPPAPVVDFPEVGFGNMPEAPVIGEGKS